ncbi:uncharacterized protein LOC119977217 [Scyliorhinus canicula]|uniref:uncharacterized protein LOC119977217 n=1 Tax=Scyliorhinus canicula TaxID=7830 RepID=UPI0018F5568E|nr:uncharacterized protein LOC119977217 [Scyliorhinus canicula]
MVNGAHLPTQQLLIAKGVQDKSFCAEFRRNKHRVPRGKIVQMMEHFEYPISSDIVLNAVEPSRNNKVLFNLHPCYNQREGKVRKKPKVLPPQSKRTRGNTQNKKKHRQHRKLKVCQNEVFAPKAETHYFAGCQMQHTTECEDDLSNEEQSEAENINGTVLVTTLRYSQESIGGQVEKILNCKLFEDESEVFSLKEYMFVPKYEQVVKGAFKMTDVLTASLCDKQMHLSESCGDSFNLENSLHVSGICWELHQRHGPLVKNYIFVMHVATDDEVNLVVWAKKYCIYINEKASAGFVQYLSEIESVFKKIASACVRRQRKLKTPVFKDDAVRCIGKKVVDLILCRNILKNCHLGML